MENVMNFRPNMLSIVTVLLFASAPMAQAQTAQDLTQMLTRPQPLTRSMVVPAPALDTNAAQFLRTLPTRGLTIEAREQVAQIATTFDLPKVDIDILFDFNTDTLRATALKDVITLGQALSAPHLSGQRFVVAGHTDGVGSAPYNLDLSQRRAETVRRVLIESFGIPEQRLIAVGFGFERLKNTADPRADENRRVELINLEVGWD
jgi:outer membrane protein OmpA-like peptidoglycan-associated protein